MTALGTGLLVQAGGAELLWEAVVAAVAAASSAAPLATWSGSVASDIAGLLSWHDAGAKPVAGVGVTLASLTNKLTAGPDLIFPASNANPAQSPTGITARPRLMGPLSALCGVGATLAENYGPLSPLVDRSINASIAGLAMGAATGRTLHLVWSRPNRLAEPFNGYPGGALILLSIGGTALLTLTNAGAGDVLALGGVTLSSAMTARHTHSVTLRWAANGTVDAWVDDAPAGTGLAQPLAAAAAGVTVGLGSAGIYLHEMAVWDHALSAADIATLLTSTTSVSKRWPRGPRQGFNILGGPGQSNDSYLSGDAFGQLEESIRYHLGALAVNLLTGNNRLPAAPNGATVIAGGTVLYTTAGTFLTDPGTGAPPSTWALGPNGVQVDAVLAALPAADLADLCAIWWYYSENDSGRAYSEKATYKAAVLAMATHIRGKAGRTAATMPLLEISALPYGGGNAPAVGTNIGGIACVREAVADLVADSTTGVYSVLPNTAAAWGRGAAADGTGGDNAHLDATDNLRHAQLAGPVIARVLAAAGLADGASLPGGLPTAGGPRITATVRESATSVLVTVQHDAGTDLVLPGGAAQGWGWVVYDGWTSVTASGTRRTVSAVARVDATHLRLTVAAMTAIGSACRLYYGDAEAKIGRGSAVTDNYAVVGRPTGADAGADLGAAWAPNMPLAVTPYGLALT